MIENVYLQYAQLLIDIRELEDEIKKIQEERDALIRVYEAKITALQDSMTKAIRTEEHRLKCLKNSMLQRQIESDAERYLSRKDKEQSDWIRDMHHNRNLQALMRKNKNRIGKVVR